MQRILSFEQTPPLADPLRYFLTAPAFALAAALLLVWQGPALFISRWAPQTLAVTHLITLGFLTSVMIGALLQMLPVVAGAILPGPRLTAATVHLLLCAGTIFLVAAFLTLLPVLFAAAMVLLVLAMGVFLVASLWSLKGGGAGSPMVSGIRLALLALVATLGLGVALASGFALPVLLPLVELTDLHALWGIAGWIGLLVIGVAYQVVPMFQVTAPYPPWLARMLAPTLLCLALAASAGAWWAPGAIALGYLLFAGATLVLIWRRKRPKHDASVMFWYASMATLAMGSCVWLAGWMMPAWRDAPSYPLTIGVLLLAGFGCSVVNGMLYKIVPFLVWYHLQSRLAGGPVKAPNVRQVIPESAARLQFGLHLLALVLVVAATIWPQQLARAAGAAFCASHAVLWFNLLRAGRIYRVMSLAIARTAR